MSSNDKEILVFADWQGLNGPLLMGRLFASRLRGKEVFQFEYEPEWLKKESVLHIDPELAYYTGRQFPSSGRNIFGVFLDSMPDRWGRQLMLRREALMARKEGREARQLFESDYLLGVYDLQREGGLRFKLVGDDRFLNDGDDFTSGASYLELADFIIRHGAQPEKDLEELWRRIVFFVCIKNTDDHLRNHGFILHNDGWRLSPAYDVNPNPKGTGLRLNISENDNALDLELARSISPFFRVTPAKANEIIHRVNETVASWQAIANRYQVSKFDHNMMMPAFCIS